MSCITSDAESNILFQGLHQIVKSSLQDLQRYVNIWTCECRTNTDSFGYTDTLPLGHRTIKDTVPSRTPYHQRHLTIKDTLPSKTPYHQGHLTIKDTLPSRTPYHPGHLTIKDTLPSGHLTIRTPYHLDTLP